MTVWAVEVQHSSDHNLDGKWFELERTTDGDHVIRLWEYFFIGRPFPPKGLRPEECSTTGSYAGRPGRIRIVS